MQVKTVESTISWRLKVPVLILVFYFLVVLPCTQIFFRMYPWLYKYTDALFFAVVVIFIISRINLAEIGFSTRYLKQHLVLGLISGGMILLSLPLLSAGLDVVGLTDNMKFLGKPKIDVVYSFSLLLEKTAIVLFIPLVDQIFFTGITLQSLLKKTNPILAVYIVSLIYTLTGFDLTLGTFGLGVGASLLFKLTGTLYASILFHMSCAIGGELMVIAYPRITVILGFLF